MCFGVCLGQPHSHLGLPEYICIVELLYTASLPELLAQFLATVTQERWSEPAPAPARVHPDLLHKPILTACPCLNRPTRASILSGYTDSVVDKVLILPPRQVHQESEPSKGVRFLESSVAAIVYHAPQLCCFALPVTFSYRQVDRVLQAWAHDNSTPRSYRPSAAY